MGVGDLRLLVDFGLVVLIWMVQLIIYPSFTFYAKSELQQWHSLYTQRISYVVVPLMLFQLTLALFGIYQKTNSYTVGSLLLIVLIWLITFAIFVPIHNKITRGQYTAAILRTLVVKNGVRTFLWTVLFLWTLAYQVISQTI